MHLKIIVAQVVSQLKLPSYISDMCRNFYYTNLVRSKCAVVFIRLVYGVKTEFRISWPKDPFLEHF